jgi:hypothetical protein
MVLDTKKGSLKADKEKGQYVDSEKRNSKEKSEKKIDIAHARAQKRAAVQRQNQAAIQYFFFVFFCYSLFFCGSDLPKWA